MHPDQVKLLQLIDKLPMHDAKMTPAAAHDQKTNNIEAQIAGITKAYVISEILRGAKRGAANIDNFARDIEKVARLCISYDGGEKDVEEKDRLKFIEHKVESLDLDQKVKDIILRVAKELETVNSLERNSATKYLSDVMALEETDLKYGHLEDIIKGQPTNLARDKFYQLSRTGNLFNQSSARMGHIPNCPFMSLREMERAVYGELKGDENEKKQEAVARFISSMGDSELFQGDNIVIYDIGPGNGKVSKAAAEALVRTHPKGAAAIKYMGIDLSKPLDHVVNQLTEAGLDRDNISFEVGRLFGHVGETNRPMQAPQNAVHIVIASHLYNINNAESFIAQLDGIMAENSVTYIIHEGPRTTINEFREKNKDLLRAGANERAQEIEDRLLEDGRKFSKYTVPSRTVIPEFTKEDWRYFKRFDQAVFDKDYALEAELPADEREELILKQKVLEYFFRAPLAAFTDNIRAQLLDDFKEMLDKTHGNLISFSDGQLVLSRVHTPELASAVEKTAADMNRHFNPGTLLSGAGDARSWAERTV